MKNKLHEIYAQTLPAFLSPYLESQALLRLQNIQMNCGVNYTSYPLFTAGKTYTRYEHSLGTALLAWHFAHDEKQALACLFHDIATPAFSHTVDFMYKDYLKQEATEDRTAEIIKNDKVIMYCLNNDGIAWQDVSDYHRYPICDNDSPKLSCDRLEYTLGTMAQFAYTDLDEIGRIYEDIVVSNNEEGEQELAFAHADYAAAFTHSSIRSGRMFSCDSQRYAMESLAGLLKEAVKKSIITEDDLYHDEPFVIDKLMHSALKDEWIRYTKLKDAKASKEYEPGCIKVPAKKRYIDPLVKDNGRIIAMDAELQKERNAFLNEDQDVWLKGVYDE